MELVFVMGSSLRRVFINGKKITLLSPENGYTPANFDLDKLDTPEIKASLKKMKFDDENIGLLEQLSKLDSEEAIAKDIKIDFQRSGWRLFKRID